MKKPELSLKIKLGVGLLFIASLWLFGGSLRTFWQQWDRWQYTQEEGKRLTLLSAPKTDLRQERVPSSNYAHYQHLVGFAEGLNQLAQAHQVKILHLPEAISPEETKSKLQAYRFILTGSYGSLLQALHELEIRQQAGRILHLRFYAERIRGQGELLMARVHFAPFPFISTNN